MRVQGAGLGLRRELLATMRAEGVPAEIDFFEIAPENWMDMGGRHREQWEWFVAQRPMVCHGLSLSLGGPLPLDVAFLQRVKTFLDRYHIGLYTEHLSYCTDQGHLYDLLPIPMTGEAVRYVAARIRQTQEILERRIAVENASFYAKSPLDEMSEAEFVNAVLTEADCDLHLDVNNVYVNSINHGTDALDFLQRLPSDRVVYVHVAGHFQVHDTLIIDSHGAEVIDPVWSLLAQSYARHGVPPTLLERDFNIPPLAELVQEVAHIRRLQQAAAPSAQAYLPEQALI